MKLRGFLKVATLSGVIVLVILELVSRFYFGLGDPPLMMADPELEYVYKPSATYSRFGNRISFNSFHMRSDEITQKREDPDEIRVLMIGDSVLEGGVLVDQSKIASELFKKTLAEETKRKVVVGNVAAKSWGPPNMLAYVKKFGYFDADLVVLLLSSHDAYDVPTFKPIIGVDPNFPDSKPLFALQEAVSRYLPRYYRRIAGNNNATAQAPVIDDKEIERLKVEALSALKQIIEGAKASGAKVLLVQHFEKAELELGNGEKEGHRVIRQLAEDHGAVVVQLGPKLLQAVQQGQDTYLDFIHVNDIGQATIADVMLEAARPLLGLGNIGEKPSEQRISTSSY